MLDPDARAVHPIAAGAVEAGRFRSPVRGAAATCALGLRDRRRAIRRHVVGQLLLGQRHPLASREAKRVRIRIAVAFALQIMIAARLAAPSGGSAVSSDDIGARPVVIRRVPGRIRGRSTMTLACGDRNRGDDPYEPRAEPIPDLVLASHGLPPSVHVTRSRATQRLGVRCAPS